MNLEISAHTWVLLVVLEDALVTRRPTLLPYGQSMAFPQRSHPTVFP